MLQDKRKVEKLVHNKDATWFMQTWRGTPAYRGKKNLLAIYEDCVVQLSSVHSMQQKMRWPEVIQIIKVQHGEQVDFSELNWASKGTQEQNDKTRNKVTERPFPFYCG